MFTQDRMPDALALCIDAALELADAPLARTRLADAIAGALEEGLPVRLDLSDSPASAPAVQLVLAARLQLERAGAFGGYGPVAERLLSAAGEARTPAFTSTRGAA